MLKLGSTTSFLHHRENLYGKWRSQVNDRLDRPDIRTNFKHRLWLICYWSQKWGGLCCCCQRQKTNTDVSSSTDAQSNRVGVLQYLEHPVLLPCDINTLCFKALIILCFFSVSEPRNIWQIFNLTSRLKRSCSCKWVKSSCRRIPEGLQYHVYKYKATPYEVVCLKGGRWQVWIPLTLEFGLKRREIKIRWDWRKESKYEYWYCSTGIVVLVL